MTKPELSIIVVSFNTKKLLEECLTSIYRHTKMRSFEVIVVDNASKDGSPQMIQKLFPKATLIQNKNNLGFGRANNQAAKLAKGKNLLFLNSDTKLTEDSISMINNRLNKRSDIAIIGCRLKNNDGSTQQSAGHFPTLPRIFLWALFLDDLPILRDLLKPYQISNKKFYKKEHEVDWITGAFFMIKKKVFKKLNGFDKKFFMYVEELDLCFRAKKEGFLVLYTPQTSIIHHKSASSVPSEAILGEIKALTYFFRKFKKSWQQPLLKLLLKTACLCRILLFGIIMRNKKTKKTYEKALKLVR